MTSNEFGTFSIADAIQITGGRFFLPMQPEHPRNDFDIDYIAHSLALQCRWMGGTSNLATGEPVFYSVAQHSCIVSDLTGRFYGLMHDASEAYLCDIPRPLKPLLGGYYEYEAALMDTILGHFGVPVDDDTKRIVKNCDNNMIFWERDLLIGAPEEPYFKEDEWHPGTTMFDVVHDFTCWSPERAKREFLDRFNTYQKVAA